MGKEEGEFLKERAEEFLGGAGHVENMLKFTKALIKFLKSL